MSYNNFSYSSDEEDANNIRALYGDRRLEEILAKAGSRSTDDPVFTRGTDDEGKEVISVKGPRENRTINLENIRRTLQELRVYASSHVSNLVNPQINHLHEVIKMFQLTFGSPVYGDLLRIVQEVYADVDPVPGTVGAIFHGCLVPTSFPGDAGCDPRCAGSIPPEKGTEGWKFCEYPVILYNGSTFQVLNKMEGGNVSRALINIPDTVPFTNFTPEEIDQLSALGIREIKITRTIKDGTYQEQSDFLPLNTSAPKTSSRPIPPTASFNALSSTPTATSTSSSTSSSTAWGWGLLLAVILLVIIIAVIFLAVRYSPRSAAVVTTAPMYT